MGATVGAAALRRGGGRVVAGRGGGRSGRWCAGAGAGAGADAAAGACAVHVRLAALRCCAVRGAHVSVRLSEAQRGRDGTDTTTAI